MSEFDFDKKVCELSDDALDQVAGGKMPIRTPGPVVDTQVFKPGDMNPVQGDEVMRIRPGIDLPVQGDEIMRVRPGDTNPVVGDEVMKRGGIGTPVMGDVVMGTKELI